MSKSIRSFALAAALLVPDAVAADAGKIAWPTFLRSGPGSRYTVAAELPRGATLNVNACTGEWCAVQLGGSTGFIRRDSLAHAAASPPSANTPSSACFESTRTGYADGERLRYCAR